MTLPTHTPAAAAPTAAAEVAEITYGRLRVRTATRVAVHVVVLVFRNNNTLTLVTCPRLKSEDSG